MAGLTVPEQVFGAQDDSQAVVEQEENAEQAQERQNFPRRMMNMGRTRK